MNFCVLYVSPYITLRGAVRVVSVTVMQLSRVQKTQQTGGLGWTTKCARRARWEEHGFTFDGEE